MMKLLCMAIVSLVFLSCSSSRIPYAWQGEAKAYLDKYQEMMLKGDLFQAQYYLKDAIKEAKNDVKFETLAVVYLSQCAMQKAMAINTQCKEYDSIKTLVLKPQYEVYKKMLLKQKIENISALGKYTSLYEAIIKREVSVSDIANLETIYAQAIGSMIVFDHGLMTQEIVNYMIDRASAESMKGLMLIWLDKAQSFATGEALIRVENQIKALSD